MTGSRAQIRPAAHRPWAGSSSDRSAPGFLEQVGNPRPSGVDPHSPPPDVDPADGESAVSGGRTGTRLSADRQTADRQAADRQGRDRAQTEGLSIRQLVVAVSGGATAVGTPRPAADEIHLPVRSDATEGLIHASDVSHVSHVSTGALDPVADRVVARHRNAGVLRGDDAGSIPGQDLGPPPPDPADEAAGRVAS